VLAAVGVPVRAYTDEMLSLAGSAYGPGWEAAVLDNVVSEEANVRQVAAKVALGEADAGVVYTSDLLAVTDDVTEIPIPDSLNVAAVYTAAPVRGGDTQTAADFIDFLRSETGTAILSTWGFTALE
jgi:molybdate transport system substrate-binding protein